MDVSGYLSTGMLNNLVIDNIADISSFLNFQDLINFDRVSNFAKKSTYTEKSWKKIIKHERLDFKYSFCKTTKEQCVVGKALLTYLLDHEKRQPEVIQETYQRFEGIMVQFPLLGAYIWQDLTSIGLIQSTHQKVFKENILLLQNSKKEESLLEGGDYLLKALSYSLSFFNINAVHSSKCRDAQNVHHYAQKAIDAKATCVGYLIFKRFEEQINDQWILDLSSKMAMHHDFRILESLNRTKTRTHLLESYLSYPPILHFQALALEDSLEKEKLFAQAIKAYGDHVPTELLHDAAKTQYDLAKYKNAALLFDRAITAYGDNVPAKLLHDAAYTQYNLDNYEKAALLFDQAMTAYGDNVPPELLYHAALTHRYFANYENAALLFGRAITAYEDNLPAQLLHYAAYTQYDLDNYEKAALLFDRAITAYGDNVPADLLRKAAHTHYRLYHYVDNSKEAHILLLRAMTACENNEQAGLFLDTFYYAYRQYQSGHHKEGALLFNQAITTYGDNVPADILSCVAHQQFTLENYADLWSYVAHQQFSLENYKEAELLFDRAITAYGNNVPTNVLYYAFCTHHHLGNYEKAALLADRAIAAYGENVPADLFLGVAEAHYYLKNYEKAILLVNQAITSYGDRDNVDEEAWVLLEKLNSV